MEGVYANAALSMLCNSCFGCHTTAMPHLLSFMQEYVNELAQSLVDVDKNPQDVIPAEKIKRLCNEAVSMGRLILFEIASALMLAGISSLGLDILCGQLFVEPAKEIIMIIGIVLTVAVLEQHACKLRFTKIWQRWLLSRHQDLFCCADYSVHESGHQQPSRDQIFCSLSA